MTTKPISDKTRELPQVLATLLVTLSQRLFFHSSHDHLKYDVSISEVRPIVMLFFIPLFSTWGPFFTSALSERFIINLEKHHTYRALQ